MPVVIIATRSPVYDKVISNLEQVRARDGMVIAIATEGDTTIAAKAKDVVYVPDLGEYLTTVLATVPLQLLAYHVAMLKGTDVDRRQRFAKLFRKWIASIESTAHLDYSASTPVEKTDL